MKRLFLLLIALFATPLLAQQLILPTAGVVTIDASPAKAPYEVLVNATVTSVVFTNQTPGQLITVMFLQDSSGHTVTFGGNISNACTVSTTANALTSCQFQYDARTVQWTGLGGGGGGITSVASLPATCTPGVTSPVQLSVAPFGIFFCPATNTWTLDNSPPIPTRGLIADYRMFPSETVAALVDYSGKGNNATGTNGTAPTIIAGSGGVACGGAGGVVLPTALNSALTISVYVNFQTASASGTYNSPIVSGVAGSLAGGAGIIMVANPNSGAGGSTIWWPETFGAGFHVDRRAAFNGTGSLTMVFANPDILYMNGINEIDSGGVLGSGTSVGALTGSQLLQICGVANGGTPTFFNGNIYRVVVHNVVLTPTEVAQEAAALAADGAARGVPQTFAPAASNTASVFVAEGDSLSSSSNGNPPWPGTLTLGGSNPSTIYNEALTGIRLVAALTHYPFAIAPLYNPNAERNAINIWGCTNDLANISTPAQCFAQMMSMCRLAKAQGFKVMLSTMVSRGGTGFGGGTNDSLKNTFNTLVRNNFQVCADDLNDYASDPNIGADGASASNVFFGSGGVTDNLHPAQTSIYNIHAPLVNRGYARIYSSNNFSGGNVYSSAASAAVATTALSESTNTVTVTFGATPANCQVGNVITIAGVTPTGYNSTAANGSPGSWLILTRSATQVTYYDATTGLGAASVQGTGVCPQQQDGDKYYTVNFGAGNTTLETCVGYIGQNIYIRNINAVASTLVPFGSETITGGGAAPTTLAANSTAILQSQLVSAAAAGCNWVRLQ